MSSLLHFLREYIGKISFNLRQVRPEDIFGDFITQCVAVDKPLSNLRKSDVKRMFKCVNSSISLSMKVFENAVNSCIYMWYRDRDFEKFRQCILTRIGDSSIRKIVETCADSLPEDEKVPYALSMCVYNGLEVFKFAVEKAYRDLKRMVR